MAIQQIQEGITGQEAADIIYQNDLENAPVNTVGGSKAPTGDAVIAYIDNGVGSAVSSIGPLSTRSLTIYDGGRGERLLTTSTFSGFGDVMGVRQNFNRVSIRYIDRNDILKATVIKYRICENDQNGAVLSEGQFNLNVPNGATVWVDIVFGIIANSNAVPIWVEYWVNGKCDMFSTAEGAPSHNYRYKTYNQDFNKNFSQESSVSSGPLTRRLDIRFFNDSKSVEPSADFSDEVLLNGSAVGEIEEGETRAPSGETVYYRIRPIDDVLEYGVTETSAVQIGGDSVLYSSSTFAGWGQAVGVRQGFNVVRIPVRPYNPSALPTWFEFNIRDTDYQGAILFTQRIEGIYSSGVTYFLDFDTGVFANTAAKNLFFQINSDGYFGPLGSTTGAEYGGGRYTTVRGTNTVPAPVSTVTMVLNFRIIWGYLNGKLNDETIAYIQSRINVTSPNVPVILPNMFHAIVGDRLQLFFRGMMQAVNPYMYDILVTCAKGAKYPRYFDYTPVTADIGTTSFKVQIKDNLGNVIGETTASIKTSSAGVSPATMINVVSFGDSLTAAGLWVYEAFRRLTGTGGTPVGRGFNNIKFCGPMTNNGAGYFGVGGWSWNNYTTAGLPAFRFTVSGVGTVVAGAVYTNNGFNYTVRENNTTGGVGTILMGVDSAANVPQPSGVLTKVSGGGDATITYSAAAADVQNPFWDNVNNKLSFIPFANAYCDGRIDVMYSLLTWNAQTPHKTDFSALKTQIRGFLDTLKSEFPNVKFKLMGIQIPSVNGGMGANYGAGGTGYADGYGMVVTALNQNKAYQELANESTYSSWVEFVNVSAQFDSEYNMPYQMAPVNIRSTVTEMRGINGVHPSEAAANNGYAQIGDVVFRNFVASFCQ